MLAIGYLHEIGLIHIALSTFIGFGFFFMLFIQMYNYYVKQSAANYLIFYLMASIWSLYGIAAIFKFKLKNACYNILDIFSKNFYGLFLAYLVFSLRKWFILLLSINYYTLNNIVRLLLQFNNLNNILLI